MLGSLRRAVARTRRLAGAGAILLALGHAALAEPARDAPPYPASDYITRLSLDWSSFRRLGQGADNWPMSWAANGNLYSAWGDGGGLGAGAGENAYVSIGVARLSGDSALSLRGENLIGGLSPALARCFPALPGAATDERGSRGTRPCVGKGLHGKSRSILALDEALYMFITPRFGEHGMDEARLYSAPLDSDDWRRADWAFTKDDPYPLVTPVFMQAGQGYADGGEEVYAYAARYAPVPAERGKQWIQRGPEGGEIVLLRAARAADLMQRASWEAFAGLDEAGLPRWSPEIAAAKPVFRDPAGVGFGNTSVYVKALDRYLLVTLRDRAYSGQFGVFEAPHAWGPWRTVFYGTLGNASGNVPANAFYASFLPSGFSADGAGFTLVFTGKDRNDALNVLDGAFTLNAAARQR